MKRKIVCSFFIVLLIMFIFLGDVKAVFSNADAQAALSDEESYVELVKIDKTTTIEGPKKLGGGTDYSVAFNSTADVPEVFYVHYYLESTGMASDDPKIKVREYGSGVSLSAASTEFKVDKSGRDSISGWVKVKLTGPITTANTGGIKIIIESEKWVDREWSITFKKSTEAESLAGTTETRDQGAFKDVLDNTGDYKPTDLDTTTSNKVEGITSKILTVVTDIGMVIAILILAILGIKYMLGSVEERAEYKKDLIPYLIGAGLLFGILMFIKALMAWGQTISNI